MYSHGDRMPEIDVPGVGKVDRKYVIGGAVLIAVILAVAYYRHSKNQPAAGTDSTTATSSTDPNAVDPATGLTYAEEASQQGGYMYGDVGYGGNYGGGFGGFGGFGTGTGTTGTTGITTNSEWLAQAESDLSGTYDAGSLTVALTKVLGGVAVTTAQRDMFLQAKGIEGDPPQGYPQPIKLVNPGQGGTKPGKVTGVKVTGHSPHTVSLAWNPVSGATGYIIAYGKKTPGQFHTTSSTHGVTVGNLTAKTRWAFNVTASNGSGNGPVSSTVSVTI
jgi:hypothetical protein